MANRPPSERLIMTANQYRTDYPVIEGRTVCQGHADACVEFGHAAWVVDGVDQGVCPRCNEVLTAIERLRADRNAGRITGREFDRCAQALRYIESGKWATPEAAAAAAGVDLTDLPIVEATR